MDKSDRRGWNLQSPVQVDSLIGISWTNLTVVDRAWSGLDNKKMSSEENLSQKVNSSETKVTHRDQDLETCRKELSRAHSRIGDLERGISGKNQDLETCKKELAQANSRIGDLERGIGRKDQDLKIYRKELSQANSRIETLVSQGNELLLQSLRVQKFLVPTEFPNIHGFEFSTKFIPSSISGGDYFDIFEHQDKMRFGLFLSSASSYGMSALFLSILMKVTYETGDGNRKSPKKLLIKIFNQMKSEGIQPKDHSSLFYALFDRRKFKMIYCNVGQPIALHYQAAEDRIQLLSGSVESFYCDREISDYKLEDQVVDLNPKDKLVFCSVGFLSLTNSEGQSWGLDQMLSIIKQNVQKGVHDLRNEIFYQSSQFSKDRPRDLSVIVIEVKERIMKLASDMS